MNYEFLSRLYWACTDMEQGLCDGLNLSELYQHMEESKSASDALDEYMERYSADEQNAVHSLNFNICNAYEKQGFINGFRIAMMMGQELLRKEARTV